ncbi:unnamed protein product [Gongylonema pulchrum]|uniref:Col_cuticle_N domain-containing protein n=1 Tax=Gongylonema pulchrum TaxID=637853 RepID=A0A183E9C6_9BILA|nr:unnamed protein product [Gongylonema pulchrum]
MLRSVDCLVENAIINKMRFGPAWQHRPGKRMESNCGGGGDECLARVPYASIIAASMCGIGVVLFSLMMAWAFNASTKVEEKT